MIFWRLKILQTLLMIVLHQDGMPQMGAKNVHKLTCQNVNWPEKMVNKVNERIHGEFNGFCGSKNLHKCLII